MKTKILALFFIFSMFATFSSLFAQSEIDFNMETLDGSELQFSNVYKNGPTLVSFWALWCKPCRVEMRHLEKIYETYKEKGLTIIGINQDSPRSVAKVRSYVASHNVTFPIVIDPNQEIFQMFNGQSIPLTVLYDKNGKVTYTHIGYLPGDEIELEEKIKSLLESDK